MNINIGNESQSFVRTASSHLFKGLERASVKVEVLCLNVLHRARIGIEQYGLLVRNKGQIVHVHVARKYRQANRRCATQAHRGQFTVLIIEREELHRVPATGRRPSEGTHRLKCLVRGPLTICHY